MIIETASMSWQLALTDPRLTRLGDWLAQQHGEEWMARLEEVEGVSRWDLEGWQTAEACSELSIVFVKDSQGQVQPFVQEEQPVQQETTQVIRTLDSQLQRTSFGQNTITLTFKLPYRYHWPSRRLKIGNQSIGLDLLCTGND